MIDRMQLLRLHEERMMHPLDFAAKPIQLGLAGDPYKVVVVCSLLNRTGGHQVRPILPRLFARYPCARSLGPSSEDFLLDLLWPLGLANRRARSLVRFAEEFSFGPTRWLEDLPGVGPYACDAVRIFCLDECVPDPMDRVLRSYVESLS